LGACPCLLPIVEKGHSIPPRKYTLKVEIVLKQDTDPLYISPKWGEQRRTLMLVLNKRKKHGREENKQSNMNQEGKNIRGQ
jgi:hypothetical protein